MAGGGRILSNVVASQEEIHRKYGGIFPEMASRRHIEAVLPVIRAAMDEAGVAAGDLGLIAVTRGPGLVGSLLVGVSAAKALSFAWGLPLVGVHHIAGHIYANFLAGSPPEWPAVCLVVSGGHTELLLLEDEASLSPLGRTRDDAAGEAFDKVARLLGLPYPGGPAIDRLAREGDPAAIPFPRGMIDDGNDFSFSGLKTAVMVYLERAAAEGRPPRLADVAASFQQAVVDVLVAKAVRATVDLGVPRILLAGGVAANSSLRKALTDAAAARGVTVRIPPPHLCTDNAAMIACAGYHAWRAGRSDGLALDATARLPLTALAPAGRGGAIGD